jgi:hypothetical protein
MNAGWHYRFGAEVGASDPHEKQIDCSEATERAVRRAADRVSSSLRLTDGSFAQYDACARAGTLISLEQARNTPGALVFLSHVSHVRPGMGRDGIYHVGMVLNRDTVLEACCANGDPIRPVAFNRRNWYKEGGLIPGVVYQGGTIVTNDTEEDDVSAADVWQYGMSDWTGENKTKTAAETLAQARYDAWDAIRRLKALEERVAALEPQQDDGR